MSKGPLDANVAAALAYVGGPLSGLLVLVFSHRLVSEREPFVRFHALQSTLTFLGIGLIHLLIRTVPLVWSVIAVFFIPAVLVLWVVLIVKALRGQIWKVPFVGEIAAEQLR